MAPSGFSPTFLQKLDQKILLTLRFSRLMRDSDGKKNGPIRIRTGDLLHVKETSYRARPWGQNECELNVSFSSYG